MSNYRIIALMLMAVVACKAKDKGGEADKSSTTNAPAPAAKTAGAPAAAAPAGCAAGFTNPDSIGVCIKVPADLKPSSTPGHAGNEKAAGWAGEGDAEISVIVGEYSRSLWDQNAKDMLAGGGFGGKLKEQGKLGTDGVWGTFKADEGTTERTMLVARVHNDKIEVQCFAERSVMSNLGPKAEDLFEACKTLTLAN
jgi:hypothetical protein